VDGRAARVRRGGGGGAKPRRTRRVRALLLERALSRRAGGAG
jgi:hypothetical protein